MTDQELISEINNIDWEFTNQDTQYLTHNIHRYSGKFIPQIANNAIKLLSVPGDTILDPYLGSGTTALEAIRLRRNSIGVDLNPLAILIAKVKILNLPIAELTQFESDLLSSLAFLQEEGTGLFEPKYKRTILNPELSPRYSDSWNKKWYQDHVLRQLIQIYDVIENVDDENLRNIAKVAFSDILRKSSNASSRYPNVMYDKNHKVKPLPLHAFKESFMAVINQLKQLSQALEGEKINSSIMLENNTSLSIGDESIDAVVTHPPYIAAVPYAEYGSLSLEWFGYSSKELDNELTGGKRHRKDVVSRFTDDYKKFMKEVHRVLKEGHYAFFMVGNPTAHGQIIELNRITQDLAEQVGFQHLTTVTRHGVNRRGNKMGEEYLEFFKKR